MGLENSKYQTKLNFLSRVKPDMNFTSLFEELPNILFFAKDVNGVIVSVNKLFAQHCGFESEEQLIGLCDNDIFAPELAEQYKQDDQTLIKYGRTKKNIVELFPNYLGDPTWFLTSKIPLLDSSDNIIGLCGTCQSLDDSSHFIRPYLALSDALEYIKHNYHTKILIEDLASIAHLSVRQFERRFKETFKTTSHQYIIKLRIMKSCKMLLNENMTIADIAINTGFYDQSAYTKSFKKYIGKTPTQYQKEHK
ncbi:AraC family transcriptional regulator [Paraglaciecola aquimarina]|uniref:AraC family transcriptional regulator n=1 Tax=Paraglaciecola algarum TaxID=3050085 RepID=A0ABS9D149_9ALTE|nr:AraC family transcriptional regulator [Paraglaciecola sp. G1-23]MCF2946653.1 AraC family transcriptional regulator [Paraglaciecola sp. G1-23]